MSKTVTNEEVEDVLSSIRRLVSEDKRPLAGLRTAPKPQAAMEPDIAQPSEDKKTSEHFVLTPALRVTPPAEDSGSPDTDAPLDLGSVARQTWTADADAQEAPSDEGADAVADDGPLILFTREDHASQAKEEAEAPLTDAAAMDALDALVHETLDGVPENEAGDEGDYADESFWSDVPEVASVQEEADRSWPRDTEENLADYGEVSAAGAPGEQEDAPEEKAATPAAKAFFFQPERAEPAQDRTEQDAVEEAETPVSDEHEEPATPVEAARQNAVKPSSIVPLTVKIAALEAAVGKIGQGWEPDGAEEETLNIADAPAMAWEDDVELDANGAPLRTEQIDSIPRAEAEPEDAAEDAAILGSDDQVIDEEMLRDLVTEIVRAELQGALGERITRNVRKLVRREIHRALTAQEME